MRAIPVEVTVMNANTFPPELHAFVIDTANGGYTPALLSTASTPDGFSGVVVKLELILKVPRDKVQNG